MELVEELVTRVLTTRDVAHQLHWETTSYAVHQALGGFYEKCLTLLDEFVEVWQGVTEERIGCMKFTIPEMDIKKFRKHLQEESDWIDTNRLEISGEIESVGNILDELAACYAKTCYLLSLE